MGRGIQSKTLRMAMRAFERGEIFTEPCPVKNDPRAGKKGKRYIKKGGKKFTDLQFKMIVLNGKSYMLDYRILPDGEVLGCSDPVEYVSQDPLPLPLKCPDTIRLLNKKLCIILNVERALKNRK